MKVMFKLCEGPIDYYFCDAEHALDWLEWRHHSVAVNKLLRMLPLEREQVLNGRTTKEFIQELTQASQTSHQ
jgi:hypothetical protein